MHDLRKAANSSAFNQAAMELKDQSAFVGAGKIHYAAFYIIQNHRTRNLKKLKESYCLLIEAVIEFKRHMR